MGSKGKRPWRGSKLNMKRACEGKILQIKRGWFDSVPDLQEFLRQFNSLVKENTWEPYLISRSQPSFFLKIEHEDPDLPQYYANITSDIFKKIHVFDELMALIDEAKFVMPEKAIRDDIDGISLNVHHLHMSAQIFINSDGDINAIIGTRNKVSIEFQTRTSPALFTQLADIVVYTKHKNQIDELKSMSELHKTAKNITLFDLQCTVNEKSTSNNS